VNGEATRDQLVESLQTIFANSTRAAPRMTIRNVPRSVIVFHGNWQFKPLAGFALPPGPNLDQIQIYGLTPSPHGQKVIGGDAPMEDFAGSIGEGIKKTIVFDASNLPIHLFWIENGQGDGSEQSIKHAHDPNLICQHIAEQTGLTWTIETRLVPTLVIETGPVK